MFFRRSFSSRYPIIGAYNQERNLRVLPSIDMQGQDPESSWVNRPKPATRLGISIRYMSISGKWTLLQVQTRPMPKKNLEKETSERRPVHAKPKGPATDKPVLMPTEASSVSPSGLAPTRENYYRPRAPLNPPEKNLGKKDYWSDVLSRGSLLRMSNSG
ncbi:hypothetical protein F2Q69_00024234 [Brassica cretica]|uniref:Uncharacterized protein n=1 Tax=Brassica cretica TaxID=69181 RepID=A0A8S9Q713_BRACR|nr:hypothetical protein F2Q69_00024234 [Brassica cretica]